MAGTIKTTDEFSNPADFRISAGTITDFTGGLTGDRFDDSRPNLSGYFNQHGIDAGIAFHDQTPQLYIEASPWAMNDQQTPAEGARGMMSERNGHLSFGALAGNDPAAYVSGEYSVRFGQAGWTPAEDHVFHNPVYDDYGNDTGRTEENIITTDGYHSYENAVTEFSLMGYADTNGSIHAEGRIEHDRSITISEHDFGLGLAGSTGYNDEAGLFARAQAEVSKILHEPSSTYGYARAGMTIAENDEFNQENVEMGVGSSLGNTIPPVELGIQYDGQEIKPALGIGMRF